MTSPGWYPDPEYPGWQRYWDGGLWTEHRAPGVAPPNDEGLLLAGWLCAIFVPIAGLVIGVMLLDRGEKQGGWILAISLILPVAFVIGILAGMTGG